MPTEAAAQDAARPQTFEFQAEIRQLLNILIHSLYTEREIFLRELISNASDALNRFQFEMLTRQAEEALDPEAELAIRITADEAARTLTISDTGVGMTQTELVENLGTIAHSGAATFLQALKERPQAGGEIIGQFGVGFYSVFMVADKVEVMSRSFRPTAEPARWVSTGGQTYEITPALKTTRGTDIIIHLKEDAAEFASPWRVEQIIKKHSDFVSYPIYAAERQVNRRTALWRKPPREVSDEEYIEFYKQLTLDFEEPLLHVHVAAEAPVDVHAILYVPARRERGFLRLHTDYGLKLYSRKVLIQEYNKDLLPNHLRFVEGVVDSEDLPLNISRESVQSHRAIEQLRRTLTGKLLKELQQLVEQAPERYSQFWREFGLFLKEGMAADPAARSELTPLLRFRSSKTEGDELISLAGHKARMAEEQKAIYYLLADDLNTARRSPHLDAFRSRQFEVLFLTDPLDSFMLTGFREFEGIPLRNVDDPTLDLPPAPNEAATERAESAPPEELAALIERARAILGERVTDVREGAHLTSSPVRLAATETSQAREMQRVYRLLDQPYEVPKGILELNRSHPLIRHLAHLAATRPNDELLSAAIEQLYDNALLLEGWHPNPAEMAPRIQQLLEIAAAARATS
ncbi:MAG: molecular chaperone HtpG [Ardenticatenaceae bacterium]|nr:molecular chaperone HtpG [Ardenticatenaceae bacterium]